MTFLFIFRLVKNVEKDEGRPPQQSILQGTLEPAGGSGLMIRLQRVTSNADNVVSLP